ncbi:D-alanyl-lipoteichoic acid biosynthesis protein DltD [Vagococcus elongatus]|uniref:Protein DltD n=1 Tax=Vagococcus elongatus TaxID=180344 RepID=A0A430ANL2_9ENTE|nr:D-alanyl-lipoteichoic acid biosynthesis protein DltD [Vagococcus elongatus]RSU09701.1 D-alanyl-lipoteichoic acid biosynthesis protein DltD [Vagococcus elongatus]
MKKKITMALGPLVLAVLLLLALFFSPIDWLKAPSQKELKKSAPSMSINVIKGNTYKNSAAASSDYLPFLGSSELSRINAFHPTVMARKYHRGYEPFLLGAPGTQSLSHFFMLHSMKDELKGKQIVFIISPQWFVKNGVSDQMFSVYYSPLQTYQWLLSLEGKEIGEDEQFVAERLLSFSSITSDTRLSQMLGKIEEQQKLSKLELKNCRRQYNLLAHEDLIFSRIAIQHKESRIKKAINELPEDYSLGKLETLAYKIGEQKTTNNDFGIANNFYSQRIAPLKDKLENSQTSYDYLESPEFSDFQLVLNELAENNVDALFVIPPVNQRWSDYTGLSREMLDDFSEKITKQLHSQGFNQVADYTHLRGEDYFMEDTIHIGWRGWLLLDQDLQTFLKDKKEPKDKIKIDNHYFLSEEWQKERQF